MNTFAAVSRLASVAGEHFHVEFSLIRMRATFEQPKPIPERLREYSDENKETPVLIAYRNRLFVHDFAPFRRPD
jgi:hypothetical protein